MSEYYKAQRTRNMFDPKSAKPFKISRSKLDLFLDCPRCFYLDRRLGVGQPPGYPFALNSAVDALLKKEFDYYREKQKPHPLISKHKIDAIPFKHRDIAEWRDSLKRGIWFHHKPSNLILTGGVDDVWFNSKEELIIVEYKATSKATEVNLDADWQIGYKRQMEIYQWLFRQNGYKVCETGYFIYCNGKADRAALDGKLEFDVAVLPYTGNSKWVESKLVTAKSTLMAKKVPDLTEDCDYCAYFSTVSAVLGQAM